MRIERIVTRQGYFMEIMVPDQDDWAEIIESLQSRTKEQRLAAARHYMEARIRSSTEEFEAAMERAAAAFESWAASFREVNHLPEDPHEDDISRWEGEGGYVPGDGG